MAELADEITPSLDPNARQSEILSAHENQVQEVIVPVIQEQIEVSKILRTTGTVRIWKTVQDRQEVVQQSLASEKVDVERVPKDEIVDAPPPVRTEGDVMVIPVLEEVVVVTKQLRLVEELRITKHKTISDHREEVTVRAEELHVERIAAEPSTSTAAAATNKF